MDAEEKNDVVRDSTDYTRLLKNEREEYEIDKCEDGNKTFKLDTSDNDGMRRIMRKYGREHDAKRWKHIGKNEDGEDIEVWVYSDCIQVLTYQSNGWMRINEYVNDDEDNMIRVERYLGRWDKKEAQT